MESQKVSQTELSIRINLCTDRDFVGSLSLVNGSAGIIAGPFPVSARSADSIAAENGNPTREQTFPFGDPPTGRYRVGTIIPTGPGTKYRSDLYGASGAVVLIPAAGKAALADACGRFEVLIHGGSLSSDGRLRVTSGHFRVRDEDFYALSSFVAAAKTPITVTCEEELQDQTSRISDESPQCDNFEAVQARFDIAPSAFAIPKRAELGYQFVAFGEYHDDDVYDVDEAVAHLNDNKKGAATGRCAQFVREALEAGGMDMAGHPGSAKDYGNFLGTKGFNAVPENGYMPEKGDIVVIDAVTTAQGAKKDHPDGHIAMYNGTTWISDFAQRDFWGGPDYRKVKPEHTFYRRP